ncbi:hypothetical protein VTL71DRAFT_261 [Oculimacula yallundae]|uniref:Uncharacterized protein n=1 Tax=Oculimacula yallundae TaxID=86028 RepID=A0ABR4CZH1_9HELO
MHKTSPSSVLLPPQMCPVSSLCSFYLSNPHFQPAILINTPHTSRRPTNDEPLGQRRKACVSYQWKIRNGVPTSTKISASSSPNIAESHSQSIAVTWLEVRPDIEHKDRSKRIGAQVV